MLYTKLNPNYDFTSEKLEEIRIYHKPDDLDVEERTIPGPEAGQEIEIKIYRPQGQEKLPMIMNVHGGGFVAGTYDNDNNRATYLAMPTMAGMCIAK